MMRFLQKVRLEDYTKTIKHIRLTIPSTIGPNHCQIQSVQVSGPKVYIAERYRLSKA